MGRRLGLALAGFLLVGACQAQSYPSRPVRVIVGFGAGGPDGQGQRAILREVSDVILAQGPPTGDEMGMICLTFLCHLR